MSHTPLTYQVQTWAESVRLPVLTDPAEYLTLVDRIQQYRRPSIPLQSKHMPSLKRSLCFVLQRPADKSRSGLVVLWPERQCCVYMSSEPKPRVAVLRLRVDPQFFAYGAGLTVFSATLSPSLRLLQIEDLYQWKGEDCLQKETFTERWRRVVQWLTHFCHPDPQLIGGVQLQLAEWRSLNKLTGTGVWNLQFDTAGERRMLWFPVTQPPPKQATPAPAPVKTDKELVTASRGGAPDQWNLTRSTGVGLGRALIRSIALSTQLRQTVGDSVPVEIKWNADFDKWEVISVKMHDSK
jgi:hypothetical protein